MSTILMTAVVAGIIFEVKAEHRAGKILEQTKNPPKQEDYHY